MTKNSRQVSACSHDDRVRQMLEAFLIHFITQLRRDAAARHPQGPSARALSFAMVCPAPTRSADAQRYLAPVLHAEWWS